MRPYLRLWTIYDHPRDFPRHFVVRLFVALDGSRDPAQAFTAGLYETLTEARLDCMEAGASGHFTRSPDDDPAILETWI